jgi:hypothetical protein
MKIDKLNWNNPATWFKRKKVPVTFSGDEGPRFDNGIYVQAAKHEYISIPVSVIPLTAGTIEIIFNANSSCQNSNNYLFRASDGNNIIDMWWDTTFWRFRVGNSTGTSLVVTGTISTGQHTLTLAWDNSILKAYVDGASVGTPINSPKLPTSITSAYIGSLNTTQGTFESSFKQVIISKIKRGDSNILSRAPKPIVDKNVTFAAGFEHNTNGYKVTSV